MFLDTLDRLKRYFSLLDLAELLKERGMDSDELIFGEENGELPLYLFDDILFETRHPSGWYTCWNALYFHCYKLFLISNLMC